MPLETARTGSERGVRATLKRATGPYSTLTQNLDTIDEVMLQRERSAGLAFDKLCG